MWTHQTNVNYELSNTEEKYKMKKRLKCDVSLPESLILNIEFAISGNQHIVNIINSKKKSWLGDLNYVDLDFFNNDKLKREQ